jgi:hypothetical protein
MPVTSLERATYVICSTALLGLAILVIAFAPLIARYANPISSPVAVSGPVEPIYRHDTRCPSPELRRDMDPEPPLRIEGEECEG